MPLIWPEKQCISKTTGAHALSITTNYSIPHGQAVTLTITELFI